MNHPYKIIIETREGQSKRQVIIADGVAKDPESIVDLGMRHSEQVAVLQKIQDQILKLQSDNLQEEVAACPLCQSSLQRCGNTKSDFHSVFTDHKVAVRRLKCSRCKWKSVPSVKSLFGASMHPDLAKLHCELGAKHSYRSAEAMLNQQSYHKRRINNHERILHVVESVGDYIADHARIKITPPIKKASHLILQVDGGHLKDKSPGNRSFEAMASVIYRPEDVLLGASGSRRHIAKKHCSASALSDHQDFMKESTVQAFIKAGGDDSTHLTALCDGASNCWSIVNAIKAKAGETTCVLDWFHIGMKFQNTRLGDKHKNEALEKAKWCVWHGNIEKGIGKLDELRSKFQPEEKQYKALSTLITYLSNNSQYIIDYEQRKKVGLVFTSNIAEATIESLINQRCKGKKHMKWTRAGVHPLLQVRAVSITKEWQDSWLDFVMGAVQKAA